MRLTDFKRLPEIARDLWRRLLVLVRPVTDRLFPWLARRRFLSQRKTRAYLMALALLPLLLAAHISYRTSIQALIISPKDPRSLFISLFALPASLGMVLLWGQVMIGLNLNLLKTYFPGVDRWHRIGSVITPVLLVIHPILLMLAITPEKFFSFAFVTKENAQAIVAAELALFAAVAAGLTSLLIRIPLFRNRWRTLNHLNYVTFALGLYHGAILGSASRLAEAKALWGYYLATVAVSVVYRLYRGLKKA